jgi:hypothetical protein
LFLRLCFLSFLLQTIAGRSFVEKIIPQACNSPKDDNFEKAVNRVAMVELILRVIANVAGYSGLVDYSKNESY